MILVTGAARSGTSVITSMLQACGGYLGPSEHANDLYENLKIREDLLKPMLVEFGGDKRGQSKFPDHTRKNNKFDIRSAFHSEFAQTNQKAWDDGTCVYKDAKLILLWEMFQEKLDNVEWLIIRRDPRQIADSCMRTPFMNTYNTYDKWLEWAYFHETRIQDLKTSTINWEEVWAEEVLNDPETIRDLVEWYGLTWNPTAVDSCIDKKKFVR